MIIKDLSKNQTMPYEALDLEDMFRYDGKLFMKVSSSTTEGEFNSYDFTKRRLTDISDDTKVEYVPSELILHERGWGLERNEGEGI